MGKAQRLREAAAGGGQHFNGKRERLQRWLLEAGWQIGEAQVTAPDAVAWAIGAMLNGQPVVIVQPLQRPDIIVIEAGMDFAEDFLEQFGKLSESERQDIMTDAKLGLLQIGCEFNGFAEPLRHIAFSQFIGDDGLTKTSFHRTMQQVLHGRLYAMLALGRRIGRPPQDNWQENINVH